MTHFRFAFIYLRRRLYHLHRCILSVRKRIENTMKPPQKSQQPKSAQHIHREEMDDLYTRNQNQWQEFSQSQPSFTNSCLVNSFSCNVQFLSTTSFLVSFLPHNKSGRFSGIFQGQLMQYLHCF